VPQKIGKEDLKVKKNRESITKNYLYKHKKYIKNIVMNGGFWRRLKYVGYNYCQ
jgi:hypothetical protein